MAASIGELASIIDANSNLVQWDVGDVNFNRIRHKPHAARSRQG